MSGNQMDTTSPAVTNKTIMYINDFQVYDLDGVQYFDSLKTLICGNYNGPNWTDNHISNLPRLPKNLDTLICHNNIINFLPDLPNNLKLLDCSNNQLTCLPFLPSSIDSLVATGNNIQCVTNYISAMDSSLSLISICNSNNSCSTVNNSSYVTIPDQNFATWLQTNIPLAMNGNKMDTSNIGVLSRIEIVVKNLNIVNLFGLQYFKNLKYLNCENNLLQQLPSLPNTLDSIDCSFNQIKTLPPLPSSLIKISCKLNKLKFLPSLPNTLKILDCRNDSLMSVPPLPNSLISLNTGSNVGLNNLPLLPNGLKYLVCNQSGLTNLQNNLPDSLIILDCNINLLSVIPNLPNKLAHFSCGWNQLSSLPPLPSNLKYLDCTGNQNLVSLPPLPNNLKFLECQNCSINSLPQLPDSLFLFHCRNNLIQFLPILPSNLKALGVGNNPINCLPALPLSLGYLDITNTNISCIPNNPLFCFFEGLGNSYYPICVIGDSLNNPNGCIKANGVYGSSYYDNNSNCQSDSIDLKLSNVVVKIQDLNTLTINQRTTQNNGSYDFFLSSGNYKLMIDTTGVPYVSQCLNPGTDTIITISSINPIVDSVNFSIKCKPGFDLGIQSILTNGIVFPGQTHQLKITAGDMSQWYNLNCAAGVSGQLTLNVSGPVTYVSPSLGSLTPIVSGTTFTYNITDFGTVNFLNDFNLIFKTDTTANSGDSICVNANITFINGDNNSNNNSFHYCYSVTNSHDPNMKEVYPINVESDYNDWFTYTIHFQNTGNAKAFNIRLVDTLDSNLDLGTFKVINYSHNNTWSINNKVAFFNFQDIQLPDSLTDTEGSKGYVQYKIKPKSNLGAGTKIKNTAYIYFDYNSPIITNTTINEYLQVVSVKELSMELQSKIYPNPNNGSFTIELSTKEKQTIQLFDITGNSLLSQTIENGKGTIDASHLSAGVYNVIIKGNTSVINKKVVIVK